jgi:hypothetical protein
MLPPVALFLEGPDQTTRQASTPHYSSGLKSPQFDRAFYWPAVLAKVEKKTAHPGVSRFDALAVLAVRISRC